MFRPNNTEKREKSAVEFVIVIVVFALLMKVFIDYFFEQEKYMSTAGFTALAQNFHDTVLAVHAQWLMDNKPAVVMLASLDTKHKTAVSVNKRGWLDISVKASASKESTPCEQIWQLVMNTPMQLMKFSIAAIEFKTQEQSHFHHCRYVLPSGQYFEYNSETGKVTGVNKAARI